MPLKPTTDEYVEHMLDGIMAMTPSDHPYTEALKDIPPGVFERLNEFMEVARMARDIPPVEIADVYVLGATGRAILIQLPNGDEHWIPRSCIIEEASPDVQEKGDHGTIVIAGWLADKKGIVE